MRMFNKLFRSYFMFHLLLHFIVPLLVALIFFREHWQKALIIMMLTMAVDIDHLLATPIYDPLRCSMGFHPLHQLILVPLYLGLCFIKPVRLVGIGLMIHMLLDSIDCKVNLGVWFM
jgi:hypothetical protein